MPEFKLPQERPFATERVDALCRELTDLTRLVFVVWDAEDRFWMPVGFSTTLTGLVVGYPPLRDILREQVHETFASGEFHRDLIGPGLQCLSIPVHRRRRTALVVAALAVDTASDRDVLEGWLIDNSGAARDEVTRRLSGETAYDATAMDALAMTVAGLATERIARLDAEDEVAEVSRKLAEGYEEITLYQRIAGKLRVSQPTEAFFLATCSELIEFLDVDALAALYSDRNAAAEPRIVTLGDVPLDTAQFTELYRHFESDLSDGREAVLANDCEANAALRRLAPGVRNMILVPLRQGRKLYGVIAAMNKHDGAEFYSTDVKLVASVSGTIAVFVENGHLYEDLQQQMLGTVRALVSSIDAKDPYTCGHSERVAMLSQRIAEQMGVPSEDVKRVYLAGLLHDIGKIGVPEAILQKTGQLATDEYETMKLHPTIGARILSGVRELEDVVPSVLHHHERLDGRGYPHGLDDGAIPLDSRIIGLADAVDAMTSNRVYRLALTPERTEREVRRCTGTQFDVRCVDALFECGLVKLLGDLPAHQPAVPCSLVHVREEVS